MTQLSFTNIHYWAVIPLALILTLALATTALAQGPTCTVSTTADSGVGSLRQCITDVDAGGVIDFNLTYPAVIPTNDDDYSFGKPLTIKGPGPKNLTIQGPGTSGSGSDSVFYISGLDATDVVTISGLTIAGGDNDDDGGGIETYDLTEGARLVISNTHIISNTSYDDYSGGGIYVDDYGTLIVYSSVISGNFTDGDGGGIYMAEDTVLTVTNSIISNNIVDGDSYGGGGISLYYAVSAYITGTTIISNEAYYNGGGITAHETDWVTVINSDISDNSAGDEGGGLFSDDGTLTVISTTITGNRSTDEDGGGIYSEGPLIVQSSVISDNHADSDGGGIVSEDGLTISNSIISYNTAASSSFGGGGILMYDGDAYITGTTISHNRVTSGGDDGGGIATNDDYDQTLTLINSHITDNYADDGGGGMKLDNVTAVISNTTFSGNEADNSGGGIQISYGSDVTLNSSPFSGNIATTGVGGAIYIDDSDRFVITNTNFISNTAGGDGGAIYDESGNDLTLADMTFTGNTAGNDGGAFYTDGTATITGSVFISNTAGTDSGAFYAGGDATIVNSVLGNNSAAGSGSVIQLNADANLVLTHTTIASATLGSGAAIILDTGTFTGVNNIIANYSSGISATTITEDYTLFAGVATPVVGGSTGAHSWVSSNFSDAGFGNAAGGVFTLTSKSWAINKGVDAGIATDYFGDARPGGGGYDLGYDETTYTGPTAVDDTATTSEDVAITISPLANDTDADNDNATFKVTAVGTPSNGGAVVISGTTQLVYTPTLNFNGTDVFTYTMREASQLGDTGTITVTVNAVNDAPVITDTQPVSVTMSEDGSPMSFSLTLHASDSDGSGTLAWSIATQPLSGTAWTVGVGRNSAIGYTPPANWHGSTVFTVAVTDDSLTDTVAVNVTVTPENDAPLAVDDSMMVYRDDNGGLTVLATQPVTIPVLLNDSDPTDGVTDSSGLTVGAVGAGSQGGAVVINANSLWVDYTPTATFTGTETFTYTASDGGLEATATVTVTVVNGDGGGSTEPDEPDGETIIIPETGISSTITVTVQIPAAVATDTFALIYNELGAASAPPPHGFVLAGLSFTLDAYLNHVLLPGYVFSSPITLTVEYSDEDVANVGAGEESLILRYWSGSTWSSDGITVVERDTANNRLVVTIAHLTEFALLGKDVIPIYLPVIVKNHVSAPDLVITNLIAAGGNITVTLENRGNAAVTDGFWVDVYFNPAEQPGLNRRWYDIATAGAAWGVTDSIPAGGELTLTVGGDYYWPTESSSSFPAGAQVYGYVDSINFATSTGAVYESNESNNLFGPVMSTAGSAAASLSSQSNSPVADSLPQR